MDIALKSLGSIDTRSAPFLAIYPSIMLPMLIAMIDQTIVAIALPEIAAEMGLLEHVHWVVVCYLIAAAISAPVAGKLGDNWGRRRILLGALAVSLAGTTICALSGSLLQLLVGRVVQGIGGGALMSVAQGLIGQSVSARDRARYQGYISALGMSANSVGPILGGALTIWLGWRSIFIVGMPLGLLAALLLLRLPALPPPASARARFDWIGLLLLAVTIISLLVALDQTKQMNQGAIYPSIGLLLMALLACALLLRHERRTLFPLLPLVMLRNPSVWRANILSMCQGALVVSLISFVPIYLRSVWRVSVTDVGFLMLPLTIGIGMGATLTGLIVGRTGRTAIMPSFGLTIVTILLLGLGWFGAVLPNPWSVSLTFGAIALSLGTVMGVINVTVISEANAAWMGTALGTVQLCRSIGAAIGTATVASVLFSTSNQFGPYVPESVEPHGLEALLSSGVTAANAASFSSMFYTAAGFAIVGTILAWTIPRRTI